MERFKNITKSKILQLRRSPIENMILGEDAKYSSMTKYSDSEIAEMYNGIYKHTKRMIVGGDYFIDVAKVVGVSCELRNVSYYKKLSIKDYKEGRENDINNMRKFYVKDYFLITKDEVWGNKKHDITGFLRRVGAIKNGRSNFIGLHSCEKINGNLREFDTGVYPEDLYIPIKKFINEMFFDNPNYITNFKVESSFVFRE